MKRLGRVLLLGLGFALLLILLLRLDLAAVVTSLSRVGGAGFGLADVVQQRRQHQSERRLDEIADN